MKAVNKKKMPEPYYESEACEGTSWKKQNQTRTALQQKYNCLTKKKKGNQLFRQ